MFLSLKPCKACARQRPCQERGHGSAIPSGHFQGVPDTRKLGTDESRISKTRTLASVQWAMWRALDGLNRIVTSSFWGCVLELRCCVRQTDANYFCQRSLSRVGPADWTEVPSGAPIRLSVSASHRISSAEGRVS